MARFLAAIAASVLILGCGDERASPLAAARPADFSIHLAFRHGSGMQPAIWIDLVGDLLTFVEGAGDARIRREVTLTAALLDETYALARRVPPVDARQAPIQAFDADFLAGGGAALTVRSDARAPDPADYAVLARLSAIGRARETISRSLGFWPNPRDAARGGGMATAPRGVRLDLDPRP